MSKCKNPKCHCEDCQCGDDCHCGENGNECCCGDKCHCAKPHLDHSENTPRLNRIAGQIEGIKKMISEGRYCMDIIIQLHAARSAIKSVERNILKKHIQHCVASSFASENEREEKIDELVALFEQNDD